MSWILLAFGVVGFLILWKTAQRSAPVAVDPGAVGPTNEIVFYWRPG